METTRRDPALHQDAVPPFDKVEGQVECMSLFISVYPDRESLSDAAARDILSLLQEEPAALVAIPVGDTAGSVYERLAVLESPRPDLFDPSRFVCSALLDKTRFLAVSEWIGPAFGSMGSTEEFLQKKFLRPLCIDERHLVAFHPGRPSLVEECRRIDAYLDAEGPIRLFFTEVDALGRIGLNQPGMPFSVRSHVASVAEDSPSASHSLFDRILPLHTGLTIGLADFIKAEHAVVTGVGEAVGRTLCHALCGLVDESLPCSAMRFTHDCHLLIDAEAAAEIGADTLRRFSREKSSEVGSAISSEAAESQLSQVRSV